MNIGPEVPDHQPGDAEPAVRARYLRVTIRLTARAEDVLSVTVVPGRPAQPLAAGHPYVAVVEVASEVVHVARYPDPLIRRSTRMADDGDHHYSVSDEGLVEVSVPFRSAADVLGVRISLADLPELGLATAGEIAQRVRERRAKKQAVRELGFADIQEASNWGAVARAIEMPETTGRFEIFVDANREYRWRLRGPSGAISLSGARDSPAAPSARPSLSGCARMRRGLPSPRSIRHSHPADGPTAFAAELRARCCGSEPEDEASEATGGDWRSYQRDEHTDENGDQPAWAGHAAACVGWRPCVLTSPAATARSPRASRARLQGHDGLRRRGEPAR